MDVQLSQSEVSAVRRLLMAVPHPQKLLDEDTLDALARLVPCDALGIGEGDAAGYCLRGFEMPSGLPRQAGAKVCDDGDWHTGVEHLAASHPDDDELADVSTGASNREAAEELCVSVATVRKHLENSYRKLGVRNRTGALAALAP